MRALRILAPFGVVVALAACGGGGGGGGGLDSTLRYFPADSAAIVVVSTDLEGEQFKALDRIVERRTHRRLESYLREGIESEGTFSWEDEVKALLGRELVVGATSVAGGFFGGGMLFAFHASDGDRLRDVLEDKRAVKRIGESHGARLYSIEEGEAWLAVDGDVLLTAGSEAAVRSALARADDGDGMTESRFRAALGDLPDDALVQAYGDATDILSIPQLTVLRQLKWFDALRTFGISLSFEPEHALLDFVLKTEPEGLTERDLPLATGDDAPEVVRRDGMIVGANRNQSYTTAFLFRLGEVVFPRSRFVRDVHALERDLHVDFVAEVLRQFNGPSASAVSIDGKTFAARSRVSDPARLQRLLPRLAPHLPRLVSALQGLRSQGEVLLFLFAPDALTLQGQGIRVGRVGDLWRVSGLTGEGPDTLFFGVVGKVFVVASSPALAHRVADEPTVAVKGARGAGVLHADLRNARGEVAAQARFDPGRVGEIVAWLQASTKRLRGHVNVEFP